MRFRGVLRTAVASDARRAIRDRTHRRPEDGGGTHGDVTTDISSGIQGTHRLGELRKNPQWHWPEPASEKDVPGTGTNCHWYPPSLRTSFNTPNTLAMASVLMADVIDG